MADLDPPQDSWFFQDDEPQPSSDASQPGEDTPPPSEPQEAPQPEESPWPEPPRPAAASDAPAVDAPSELALDGGDSWLLGSEAAEARFSVEGDPAAGEGASFSSSVPEPNEATLEPPAFVPSGDEAPEHEDSAFTSAPSDSVTDTVDPAEPVAIEFDPWMDGEGPDGRAGAAEPSAGAPHLIEGSWAEDGSARPSVPVRPFRWLGLGAAAAALAFAALELQGDFDAQQSVKPLAPAGSIEFGVRLAGPESAGSTGQDPAVNGPSGAQPGAHAPTSPRTLRPVGRSGGSGTSSAGASTRSAARTPSRAASKSAPAPSASAPATSPSVARALDPARTEAVRTLASFDALLHAPAAPAAVRPARKEPAASPFLRDTLLQGPARMASAAVRSGAQHLLAASPLLALQQDFEVGEAYRTWFLIQTDSLGTGAQLIADPFRRVTWCVGEPPSEAFLRQRAARREAAAGVAAETTRAAAPSAAEAVPVPTEQPEPTSPKPGLQAAEPEADPSWVWIPDPVRSARQAEEAAGEPAAPWSPFGSEAAPVGEARRTQRPIAVAAAPTRAAIGPEPAITGHALMLDEPADVTDVFLDGMRWADQVGAGTASPSPILWSRAQGWLRSDQAEDTVAKETPAPTGTLRRVDTGTWRGEEPPAALFEGPARIATPSVGPVRVTMTSGELFEGDLEAVGQGRIWLRTSLGSLSLETARTETVERLDPSQVERTGLESRDHDHAGKPHVRVIAPGGVFSGRLLRHEGDAITLWEDGGFRITLHGARLADPAEGSPISLRRGGQD